MKNWIILALIATCAILWFTRERDAKDAQNIPTENVKQLVDTEVKRVNKKIDEKGFQHAVIDEVSNTVNDLSQLSDSVKRELDSVTQLLGIRDKQIKQYISYSATLKDSLLKAKQKVNQSGDTVYNYTDKWANITYVPNVSGGHFDFSYNAEINYAEYWKRKNIFAPKKHYVDFWISDKRATINGIDRIKFETEKKPSTLRINALGMYHDGFHAGADGQIRIGGRYWFGGGYLYDFDAKEWKPIFTGRISIIDL